MPKWDKKVYIQQKKTNSLNGGLKGLMLNKLL